MKKKLFIFIVVNALFSVPALAQEGLITINKSAEIERILALKKEMKAVGFDKVEVFGFGEGNDNRLIRDSESRRWETIYIEGVKNI